MPVVALQSVLLKPSYTDDLACSSEPNTDLQGRYPGGALHLSQLAGETGPFVNGMHQLEG